MNHFRNYLIASATLAVFSLLSPNPALAHCPLCTVGAGLVAVGAYSLGVSGMAIGIFIGAFALALGLWIGRLLKKRYIPYQDYAVGVFSWFTTVLPMLSLFADYRSSYLHWGGSYGSLFNRTYTINLFLLGAILGAIVLAVTPRLSRAIAKARGGATMPFQGVVLSFLLLIVTSLLIELIV